MRNRRFSTNISLYFGNDTRFCMRSIEQSLPMTLSDSVLDLRSRQYSTLNNTCSITV